MGKLGETKLAKRTVEEFMELITTPTMKGENEISFGEFMDAYDPKIESHNFTYLVPDHRNFLNLQIYDTMRMSPFVVLKLEHPLIYKDGLRLEFHVDPKSRKDVYCRDKGQGLGRSIQCTSDYLYNEILKIDRELYEGFERRVWPQVRTDRFLSQLEEKVIFRREYFPQSILEEVEKNRKYQKSLGSKRNSD